MVRSEYLDTFAPMQRAKVSAALERQMRLSGVYMFRWQAAEKLAQSERFERDEKRGRVYVSNAGVFYDESALTKSLVDYVIWIRERVHV